MIWLIGYKGMLGTAVLELLKKQEKPYMVSDQEIDITNMDRLNEFTANKTISWIINCAAYTAVDKAEDEQELAFKINAEGPFNIAQIIREKGAKLIHISTDYVFDGTKDQQWKYNLSRMQKVIKRRQVVGDIIKVIAIDKREDLEVYRIALKRILSMKQN